MKKLSITFLLFLTILYVGAQEKMKCCSPTSSEEYASNGNNKFFKAAHEDPLPFVYESLKGKDITYKTSDGVDAHAFEIKADNNSPYYLFVIHEWYGLNGHIKQEAEKLHNDLGINVIALDLYDNKVAANRDDASKYMQMVKTERAINIIKGAYSYAGSEAKVFTIGWCFGGGWSLQTAIEGGNQATGSIMYYGQPEKDVDRLKTLKCDIIGFFGNQDEWPSPQMVDEFVEVAKRANVNLMVHRYEANHGFANPSNPIYDKEATEDAHKKSLAFIRERMK